MIAIHNRKPADTSALARPLRLQETIAELILEAMTFCVESKVEETVRKWLTTRISRLTIRMPKNAPRSDDFCARTLHFHTVDERNAADRPNGAAI